MRTRNGEAIAAGILAAVLVALAALRATFGISFLDDGYYVAVPLRLATGARAFVDESTLQVLGSLVAVPFTAVWHAVFGVSGIVLASRLFYVALAATVGYLVVRALRPTLGPLIPLVAVAAVILAPPYNVLNVSYNTTAQLMFTLSVSLVFSARRDGSRLAAAGAGACAVVGSLAYPPLGLAAIATAIPALVILRDRRLWLWLLVGGGTVLGAVAIWLLATASAGDLLAGLQYALQGGSGKSVVVGDKVAAAGHDVARVIRKRAWWPAMALAVFVAAPLASVRVRAWAAAVLPAVVAIRGGLALLRDVPKTFGLSVLSYLLAFTVALLPLAVMALRRSSKDEDGVERLLILGGTFAAVAVPTVLVVTNSGFFRGMSGVGAAPLALAVIMCWLLFIRESAGRRVMWFAMVALLAIQLFLLFAVPYKDDALLRLDHRITTGAAAGILTTDERAASIAQLEQGLRTVVRPDSTVLIMSAPLAYLLTDAEPLTNVTWVPLGEKNRAVLDYYRRIGRTPDIVVLSRGLMSKDDDAVPADPTDAVLAWVTANYTPSVRAGYVIMTRR